MKEEIYCTDCQIQLPRNVFGFIKGFKFKDGYRCDGCARNQVNKFRSSGKKV